MRVRARACLPHNGLKLFLKSENETVFAVHYVQPHQSEGHSINARDEPPRPSVHAALPLPRVKLSDKSCTPFIQRTFAMC